MSLFKLDLNTRHQRSASNILQQPSQRFLQSAVSHLCRYWDHGTPNPCSIFLHVRWVCCHWHALLKYPIARNLTALSPVNGRAILEGAALPIQGRLNLSGKVQWCGAPSNLVVLKDSSLPRCGSHVNISNSTKKISISTQIAYFPITTATKTPS